MKYLLISIFLFSAIAIGCQSGSNPEQQDASFENSESGQNPDDSQTDNADDTNANVEDENTVRLIQLTLKDLLKDDISKGLLDDSLSRQFKFSQYDLNGDGKREILVGLTGPFFCGTGGCTQYLLTDQGDVITRFSVVRYPVFVANETTNGWRNLIMYSGRTHRIVTFDGKKYPSNPSTLTELQGEPGADLPKLVDWENSTAYTF